MNKIDSKPTYLEEYTMHRCFWHKTPDCCLILTYRRINNEQQRIPVRMYLTLKYHTRNLLGVGFIVASLEHEI